MLYHITQETLREKKLLKTLKFSGYSQEFSPWNLGAWYLLTQDQQTIRKIFFHKNLFSINSQKFSLQSFRYTVLAYETVKPAKLQCRYGYLAFSCCHVGSKNQHGLMSQGAWFNYSTHAETAGLMRLLWVQLVNIGMLNLLETAKSIFIDLPT